MSEVAVGAGSSTPAVGALAVGDVVEVDVGAVAHGGHCVARFQGRVIFVRHTAPGERVRVRITQGGDGDRFLRGDAVEVLTASADRVPPRCPVSGPGGCGGCDWQHLSTPAQRRLKAQVVHEQLERLAGLDVTVLVEPVLVEPVLVEPVPGAADGLGAADGPGTGDGLGADDGLGWRTRVRHAVSPSGRLGFRAHRSHDVVEVDTCPIAHPGVRAVQLAAPSWPGAAAVEVVAPAEGPPLVVVEPAGGDVSAGARAGGRTPAIPRRSVLDVSVALSGPQGLERLRGRTWVREQVALDGGPPRDFRVTGSAFWQVHPGAATVLVRAVLAALDPQPGEQALDLYAGVGLFAAALAGLVGDEGAVLAIESHPQAVRDARRNLHDLPRVGITAGRVDRVLATTLESGMTADLVVLDPPRDGAGRRVVEQIAALRPRAVAYVACDPASLARDVRTFGGLGYRLDGLRAFDCFPMTQHVECVARLVR
jgi:tRNA/tmRNA/rRNA uracil-C5-methylase (TrmA/RlmC/RlmD family)